jgi:transposase
MQRGQLFSVPSPTPPSQSSHRKRGIITDHAPYHPSRLHKPWRERQADHFALDFLPAYSPAVNPSERAWKLTRRRCLHHRYFPNLDEVTSAVETEFATGTTRNEVLRRLCAIT